MSKRRADKTIREARRAAQDALRRDKPRTGRFWLVAALGAGLGAIASFLLDPQRGRSRRAQFAGQAGALVRDVARMAERGGRMIGSRVGGAAEAVQRGGQEGPMPNDASLAMKVESELFRDPDIPKGDININAEQGIVVLRGEVPDEGMKEKLEKETRSIPGVWEVENLLHLPGEPAPTHR